MDTLVYRASRAQQRRRCGRGKNVLTAIFALVVRIGFLGWVDQALRDSILELTGALPSRFSRVGILLFSIGFDQDADRITLKFLSMVLQDFRRDHNLHEKYDVVSRSTRTHVTVGYVQNVTGFGWTNAVFLVLLNESPPELVAQLRKD